MIEPFKYMIQPIAVERDEKTGRITREIAGEVAAVFSIESMIKVVTEFEEALSRTKEGGDGGAGGRTNGAGHQLRQPDMPGKRARPSAA